MPNESAERVYFGKAQLVFVTDNVDVANKVRQVLTAEDPEKYTAYSPGWTEAIDIESITGMSESKVHVYIRMKTALAKMPLPKIPADKMDTMNELLEEFFAMLEDDKLDWNDLDNLWAIVRAARKLMGKR